jgi:hypothetical protein
MFTHFMAKYQKQYDSWEEQQQRYKIFKENLKRAVLLNQQNPTAVFSVTKFSDLTPEASIILLLLRSTQFIWGQEFRSRYLMNITASDFPSDTMHRLVLAEGPMVPFTTVQSFTMYYSPSNETSQHFSGTGVSIVQALSRRSRIR